MGEIEPFFIELDKEELKFSPIHKEIIYFETEYNEVLNNIIVENWDAIQAEFSRKGKNLVFLPFFNNSIDQNEYKKKLKYEHPSFTLINNIEGQPISYADLAREIKFPSDKKGSWFIRFKCVDYKTHKHIFSAYPIKSTDPNKFITECAEYCWRCRENTIDFHIISRKDLKQYLQDKTADDRFHDDVYLLTKEIIERVNKLRIYGLSSLAIKTLIGNIEDEISEIYIDKFNRIFLIDYDNIEIKLSPLHKAVYFLFLNHPEGIYFKDLVKHKDELIHIYSLISGRDDKIAIVDSIEKIIDPYDNSINEKCARIKSVFISKFKEELAQWYYIDGGRGEAKKIKLPQNLIKWDNRERFLVDKQ